MDTTQNRETPWGYSDFSRELAPGIVEYMTPSHGGIWLSLERQAQLVQKTNHAVGPETNFLKTTEWWEEDCDWAIPFAVFADDIKKHGSINSRFETGLKAARESIKYWHPELTALY